MNQLIWLLVLIASFNNLVAILQFTGNPIGWSLGNFFGDVVKGEEFADQHTDIIGFSVIPGVFDDSVMSGFFTAIVFPLLFSLFSKRRAVLSLGLLGLLISINVYGCYVTQQRTAFILVILTVLLVSLKFIKTNPFLSLLALFLVLAFTSYSLSRVESFDWGRLLSSENAARSRLQKEAIDFISEHPFFGGPVSFRQRAGMSSHNVFLDSIICAGMGGGIIIAFLWIWSVIVSLKNIVLGFLSKVSQTTFTLAIAFFNTMIYGLLHNTSYLTGYNIIFILLALLLQSIHFEHINHGNSILFSRD